MIRAIAGTLFICALLLTPIHAVAQSPAVFHFTEKPGPYPVGLKVVDQYDHARAYRRLTDELGKPQVGERARPLQTLIWYPAEKSATLPFTVGDYANLMSSETSFDQPRLTASSKRRIEGLTPTLGMPLWALRDAPVTPGHFPVVIYAPGASGWSWENADLCEYLASHGYVVIASNSMGSASRNMTIDVAGINAQAADISYLVGYAQTLPDTDMSKIAVAGYSFGGLSALAAASRDNRIDALVTLDGSMRYYPDLVKDVGGIHPDQMTIPLLAFTQGEITIEDQIRYFPRATQGPNVLNEWQHGDLLTVHMLGLAHVEFSAMNQRNEDVWKNAWFKVGYERQDGVTSYAWVARYTVQFLDAYLKHDEGAMAYLKKKPAELGVPDHFVVVDQRVAHGPPASIDTFRAELGSKGFDHAPDVYASMKAKNPEFTLSEVDVDRWADELISNYHMPEAMALLQMNAHNYPQSGNTYESLGEANLKSGNKKSAIENFKKALEMDPNNADAQQQLKKLGAT